MFSKKSASVMTMFLMLTNYTSLVAEEVENGEKIEIADIVVEGRFLSFDKINSVKTPTPIIDVPQSISITTSEEFIQRGNVSIGDIIDYTPGVNTSQGEGHRDSVVFRGVRSTADFFIDGARDDVQYYRPLYNVEQIEVLRGPNALLFGRGGTGGILNRVTKKARLGERFTRYKSSVNTFAEHNFELDGNIAISNNSALRINAMYEGLDNHRDFYDGDRFGFNPTITVELSPVTVIDLSYEYINHQRFIDRGIPTGTNGEPVEAFDDIVFGDSELNSTDIEAHVFRAVVEHAFSENLKGNLNFSYGDYDKTYTNFYASDYDQANTPDRFTIDGYEDITKRQNLILSGNLVGEFNTGGIEHTLLFGSEYIDTSSDQYRLNAVWDTTNDDNEVFLINGFNLANGVAINSTGATATNSFSDLNDDTNVEIEAYSLYIQDQIELTSWLDIVLGARYDNFDIEVNNVDPASTSFGVRTNRDEQVSPRAGIILKPQENISLYASYSESFLPRSGEQFANINGTANQLDADEFESKEVGVKWDFAGMSLTTALFRNEQTRSDRDNTTGEQFEIRGIEIEGVELSFQGSLTDQLYLTAGYTYLDGKTSTGAEPRELPENMFSLWSQYQFTSKFGLGLGLIYQDDSLITDGGTAFLPSYTRVDAAAYYDVSKKLRLQLNIENLTNESYFPNAHSTHQATVAAPINAMFTVRGEF